MVEKKFLVSLGIFQLQREGGVCLQWEGGVCLQREGGVCLQWEGGVCLQWEGGVCLQWEGGVYEKIAARFFLPLLGGCAAVKTKKYKNEGRV
ncbi:hypothetical protein MmiHf6_10060 [Methanimicrococcus hongohii]|uniref:Uncharacterized protein n=1 Tax=Methanimicrococcus hongohii TaxID=3028295 RepID=A0AA97A203_9EURY|nr:hypothetical protein MmiHf6_10060 [Methanimicrococcus sp. Hf6]